MNTAKQHTLFLKNIWLWSFSVTLPPENFHAETRVVSDDRKIPLFATFTAAGQL